MVSVSVHKNGFLVRRERASKCLIISRKRHSPSPALHLEGMPVEQVRTFKLLGVHLSSDFNWAAHISSTCCKAKWLLGLIFHSFGLANSACLTRLYKSLVCPLLEYCDCIWDPHQAKYSRMLESVQSFAVRIATKHWQEHSSCSSV